MSLISTSAGLQRQVLTPLTALTPKASVHSSDKVTMPKLLDCLASARQSYNQKHIVSTNSPYAVYLVIAYQSSKPATHSVLWCADVGTGV
jgi:hypothetical protein